MICPLQTYPITEEDRPGYGEVACREEACAWWLGISRRCVVPAIWSELQDIASQIQRIGDNIKV